MKVLLLMGNPRKSGVSQRLADIVLEGLVDGGAEVETIDLSPLNIAFCKGCFGCVSSGGKCVLNDDMSGVIASLLESDLFVCVTPLYFYGMSAKMKLFFDRLFPLISGTPERLIGACGVSAESPLCGKKFATISVALGRLPMFDALTKTYAAISESMGLDWIANVRRGESAYFLEDLGQSRRMKRIFSAFRRFGGELARGHVSGETVAEAELELSESEASFAKGASVFWRRYGAGNSKI